MSYDPYQGHPPFGPPPASRRDDGANLVIRIVRLVTSVATSVFLLHIAFVVLGANPANAFVDFVDDLAGGLMLGLGDVFTPDDATLWVVLNYGFAALVYLVVGHVIVRALRRP